MLKSGYIADKNTLYYVLGFLAFVFLALRVTVSVRAPLATSPCMFAPNKFF